VCPTTWTTGKDIVFLCYAGVRVIVVHGGGPQINSVLDRFGVETAFASGLRGTSPEMMDVVRMVLVGQVNRDLVGLINVHGPFAIGMSGEDAHLMTATRRHAVVDGEHVDVGLAGDVVACAPTLCSPFSTAATSRDRHRRARRR